MTELSEESVRNLNKNETYKSCSRNARNKRSFAKQIIKSSTRHEHQKY